MTATTSNTSDTRITISPAVTTMEPRLRLQPPRLPLTLLDGAWWPRSADPVAELPALIRAVQVHRGHLSHLLLHADGWDSTPRRLHVDGRVIRLAWFTSGPVGLLTTICPGRDRVDLLVLPPDTPADRAEIAMAAAADAGNTMPAPEILAAIHKTSINTTATDRNAESRWESDGHLRHPAA